MRRYLALFFLLIPHISIASCIDYPTYIHRLGGRDTFGQAQGLAISGALAYVADGTNGLQIIDRSSPTAPTFVGSIATPSMATDVVVSGSLAYVTDRNAGLQVINTANPASPILVGSADTPGEAYGLAFSGTFAYIADWNSGIHVIDASNPSSPQIVKTVPVPHPAYDVEISGNYLYVADDTYLQVIDISSPTSAFTVGSVELPSSSAQSIAVSGGFAYLATYSGMAIVNVSNPNAPALVSFFGTPNMQPLGVAVSGNIAYVIGGKPGDLRLINVSNPSSPVNAGSLGINPGYVDVGQSGRGSAVVVTGSVAYVAAGALGLQIFDVGAPAPGLIGNGDTPDTACDVATLNAFAYVADGHAGLQVIDIANPEFPMIVGNVDTPGRAVAIAIGWPFAYVADQNAGLEVIDISIPSSPTISGSVAVLGGAWDLSLAGSFVYVTGAGGLTIIDVSNPTTPVILGTTDTPEAGGHAIAVQGSFAYILDRASADVPGAVSRFWVINVDNPAFPIPVSSLDIFLAHDVAVFGTKAFITEDSGLMEIIDISNPESPGFATALRVQPDALYGLAIDGPILYVASGTAGVQVVHMTYPASPNVLGSGDTFGHAGAVAVSDEYVLVADGESGLTVLPRQCRTTTAVVPDEPKTMRTTLGLAIPNPFASESVTIPFSIQGPGRATLRIIDISGREVRVLVDRVFAAGDQQGTWNGRDSKGQLVPDGLYFYQLVTPGHQETRKLVRIH